MFLLRPTTRLVPLLALTLASAACLPSLPGASTAANTDGTTQTATAAGIRLGKVVRGDLNGVLTFSVPIEAKGQVAIIPRVQARLDQLHVDLGSRVHAGDTLAELDHAELDQQLLAAQAAQATAQAKLDALKAGPKPEVLAQAQADQKAAQARVNALEAAQNSTDLSALDKRVQDAQAAVDQAQAALQPDAQAVAQADAVATAAHQRLTQMQNDPTQANNKTLMDQARADAQKADDAAAAARKPSGSQAALDQARQQLAAAQQAQLMARLSTTAFDLDQAHALLEVANAEVNLAQAPASDQEIKAAEDAVQEAYAQTELANARVQDATLTAPIDGVVTQISATVGSVVGPQAAILTLIPPTFQVTVNPDQDQIAQVQVGQAANLSVEGFPNDAFNGTVKGIAPVLNPRTRTVAVRIDVPDPQGKLRPGMLAQVAIQTGQRSGALLVPKEAVLRLPPVDPTQPLQDVVFTVANGRVHRQVVTLGTSDGTNVEVLQGLSEGTDLVLNPRPDFLEGELIATH